MKSIYDGLPALNFFLFLLLSSLSLYLSLFTTLFNQLPITNHQPSRIKDDEMAPSVLPAVLPVEEANALYRQYVPPQPSGSEEDFRLAECQAWARVRIRDSPFSILLLFFSSLIVSLLTASLSFYLLCIECQTPTPTLTPILILIIHMIND